MISLKDVYEKGKWGDKGMRRSEFVRFLRDLSFAVTKDTKKKIRNWCRTRTMRRINMANVLELVSYLKGLQEADLDVNLDYVDVFVSLGGNIDMTGIVER